MTQRRLRFLPTRQPQTRHTSRPVGRLAGFVALALCLAGCASETLAVPPVEDNPLIPEACEGVDDETAVGLTGLSFALCVGPATLTGHGVESATAVDDEFSGWLIGITLAEGPTGVDEFNVMASECFQQSQKCPTGRLAVSRDRRVITAPTIKAPSFARDEIQISGDFTEQEANDINALLNDDASKNRIGFHYVLLENPLVPCDANGCTLN